MSRGQRAAASALFVVALLVSISVTLWAPEPGLWGLVPVVVYAFLALCGVDMVLATLAAIVCGVILARVPLLQMGEVLLTSLGDFIALLGVIIMLGAGLGEVIRRAGVADYLVVGIVRRIGVHTRVQVRISVMLACGVLAFALGTLAGSVAIVAPIIIPIAALVGYTPPATAAMFFFSGLAGLILSPFAPATIAVFSSAKVSWAEYVITAGGPVAVVIWIAGFFVVAWNQRRTEGRFAYPPERAAHPEDAKATPAVKRATAAFLVTFAVLVAFAAATKAGATFVPIAMVALMAVVGLASWTGPGKIMDALYAGASRLLGIFFLFWMLAVLFTLIDMMKPYDTIVAQYGDSLSSLGPYLFAVAVALVGWVGVAGAAAAQAVLLSKVFGPVATALGISPEAWTTVLLASAQTDGLGPFPNPDMIGQMGLAESSSLKWQLLSSWLVMIPVVGLYLLLLAIYT
ncbi:Na+/H+ antiporter NhaC family protein [Spongiactinospora sp. TRM90649]|uniref:Na+/H+ antiporter NhaC family protein n=1 Tax=Spongiactinospora sp. TRM90649 TaxID=3031114 RepID=UPI0023F8C788|nr:Na+/H+ antiporter NhaC family protein [Spongiactinospora sp. TRM90649]MDF5752270.1 Na+/H+ antiporter NhaC family protein [Spongiactinospora sp. TRM90649]